MCISKTMSMIFGLSDETYIHHDFIAKLNILIVFYFFFFDFWMLKGTCKMCL